jgi:hypothetical protein
VDPKKIFLFSYHSLEVDQSFYAKEYEENTRNVFFQPFETENFCMKKHHFWNFSSPASKKFFLASSNILFHYRLKIPQNSENVG